MRVRLRTNRPTVLYHRKAKGAIKMWSCWVEGNRVCSRWGQQGGKMSVTKERCTGEPTMSANEVAQMMAIKKIEKRLKKGYVRDLNDVVTDIRIDRVDFDRLPKSFAPAKPIKSYDPDEMAEWAEDDKLFIQRKRDGVRMYLVSNSKGQTRIYSSGKEDITDRLSWMASTIMMPPKTILDCELVVENSKGDDEFNIVTGIAKSKPARAAAQIALIERSGMQLQLHAFDLLWFEGEEVYKKPYEIRYRRLAKVVDTAIAKIESRRPLIRMPLVLISRTRLATLAHALDLVKNRGWEGLVVWRKDQATIVHVNGSPARVNCWKVKPIKEEDVIATHFEFGKGKNERVVGAFNIGLYRDGRLVRMGNCGSGLDDDTREEALTWKYPCVIQIEYDQKSDTGFRFPVFKRKRDDKKPSECVG